MALFQTILLFIMFDLVWSELPIVQMRNEAKDPILAIALNTIYLEETIVPTITVDFKGLEHIKLLGPVHVILPSLSVPQLIWDKLASMMISRISIVTQTRAVNKVIPKILMDKVEIVLLTSIISANSNSWLIHRKCPSHISFTPWIFTANSNNYSFKTETKCPFPLQNHPFLVSAHGRRPFIVRVANSKTGDYQLKGLDVDLFNMVANKLNIKPTIKWTKGRPDQFKMLSNGSALYSFGHLSIQHSVAKNMEFSPAYYPLEMKLLTRKPRALKPFWNAFKPYSLGVWLSIFCTVLVSSMTVVILTGQMFNILNVYATLLGQSCWQIHHHSSFSLSIFILAWLVFTFFVNASYECNLRAYLMSVDFEPSVDSATDLVEQNRDCLFPPLVTGSWYLVSSSVNKNERIVAAKAKEKDLYMTFSAKFSTKMLTKHVLGEDRAILLHDSMYLAEFPDLEKHYGYLPFRISKYSLINGLQGMGINKKVLGKEEFNLNFLRLVDAGFPTQLFSQYIESKYLLPERPASSPPEPFILAHILAPMLLLFVGAGIATLIFVREKLLK